jgi:hypothetical protein
MWESELYYVLEEGTKDPEGNHEDDLWWCVPEKYKSKTVNQCRAMRGNDPRVDRTTGEIEELGIVGREDPA